METLGANSDDISVWELASLLLVSRFELCVLIRTNVAQFLVDIRAISLSSEEVNE